jgi:EAL domain-containing protein (putative c-di-GMP-specific phosphodiesterase class I)
MQQPSVVGTQSAIPRFASLTVQDRSGIRRLLRGRLGQPLGIIEIAILLVAATLSLGQPRLFLLLGALVAASVVADILLVRLGRPVPTDVRTRLWLAAYPLAFVILGYAGWSPATGDYHGEVIALMVIVVAAYVGMVESPWFAIGWSLVSAVALLVGIAWMREVTPEAAITVGAIFVGCAFGVSLLAILESFLGHRQRLIAEIRSAPVTTDPFELAAGIIESLHRWTQIRNGTFIWFTEDGHSTLLAVGGEALPAYIRPHKSLPPERNAYLREHAATGPWITGWVVDDRVQEYSRGIAEAGVSAVAYVPFHHDGRVLGVLTAAVGEAGGGRSALSEQFPLFVEVADLAGTTLGPALAVYETRATASTTLDAILRDRAFHPVFQPIRDLTTDRIVGYEALTRFDQGAATERLFLQAETLGRLRELEVATLKAAIDAAVALPAGVWLSVNSSAELLVDTDALEPLLRPARRPIVIEISEHIAIDDYRPIAAALDRLGPGYSLAVDDAGSGFASLRHILEIKPAYVKLDLRLVQGVADDATRRALVAGFAHFAREAGFELIAEGIETDADLTALRKLEVSMGQGYLLGRPKPVAEAAAMSAA